MKDLKIDDYRKLTDKSLKVKLTDGKYKYGVLWGGGAKNLADEEPYDYILLKDGVTEYIPLFEIEEVEVID